MIRTLRKKHLQVWRALALLLPAAIIAAWLVIPQPVKDRLLQPSSTAALPVVLKKIDKGSYCVSLRSSADGASLQLEWVNRTALTTPSAILYQVSSGGGRDSVGSSSAASVPMDVGKGVLADPAGGAWIIGRIGERGTYHFPLRKDYTGGDSRGRIAAGRESADRIAAEGGPGGKDSTGAGLHFLLYDIIHHQFIDSINF